MYNVNLALTATTPKLAQSFTADTKADTFTLDFIELSFGNIGDTATIADGITVTLNADSSGDPGGALCTLGNPTSFSSSGAHKFYAPHSGISTLCPLLVASTSYHVVVEKDSSYTSGVNITHYQLKGTNKESAFDWSIPDEAQHYTSSAWADNATEFPMLIDVRARLTFELAELTETEVLYGWSLIPEGVTGGQKFRLMFLTEGDKPTSTDIDIYNQFVQGQAAAGHADVQEHANQFRVLASTADDEARDNTETTSSDTDAPIYWLNGAKVADNYADLYDGTWDEEVNRRTPTGDPSTASHFVWTGSDDDGTGREETSVSVALGETSVRQGEMDNSSTTRNPLSASTVTGATNTAPFYALSGIFRGGAQHRGHHHPHAGRQRKPQGRGPNLHQPRTRESQRPRGSPLLLRIPHPVVQVQPRHRHRDRDRGCHQRTVLCNPHGRRPPAQLHRQFHRQ